MLYFKDFVYDNRGNRKYEIVEYETQQNQVYTYEQVHQLLDRIGYTLVYGVVYTGSKIIFKKKHTCYSDDRYGTTVGQHLD